MRKLSLIALLLLPAVALAGARSSNWEKKSKMGEKWFGPNAVLDGKPDTAWMVPGESPNRGEWIEIDIPRGEVDKIALLSGYLKNDETFGDYPRLKKVRVDIFALDDDQNPTQVGSSTVDIADTKEWQIIDLTDAKVNAGLFGGRVRISVVDIYDGADFPNLGVSEIYVVMKEIDGRAKITSVNDGDVAALADAVDENPKTFSKLAAGSTFKFESTNFGISSVGFVPVKDYARPKTVEVSVNGLSKTTVLPEKGTDAVWAEVPAFNGYVGGAIGEMEVKIVDTWPAKNAEIGVTEVKFRATNFDG
jgi:hypothetical protein